MSVALRLLSGLLPVALGFVAGGIENGVSPKTVGEVRELPHLCASAVLRRGSGTLLWCSRGRGRDGEWLMGKGGGIGTRG